MKTFLRLMTLCLALGTVASAAEPAIEIRRVVPAQTQDAVARPLNGEELWLEPTASFDSHDIQSAAAVQSQDQWTVFIAFTPGAAARFGTYSKDHIGSRLALLSRGQILSAPVLREAITGGTLQISGNFTQDAALKLAQAINSEKAKPQAK